MIVRLLFILLIFFVSNSCRKKELEQADLTGKWKLNFIAAHNDSNSEILFKIYYKNFIYPPQYTYINNEYDEGKEGELTVDLNENGKIIYKSKSGNEKFKIVKQDPKVYTITTEYYDTIEHKLIEESHDLNGWEMTVKNTKGKRFIFRFIYDPHEQKLIGVAWYKGILFSEFNQPVKGGEHYGKLLPIAYFGEYLGVFEKID